MSGHQVLEDRVYFPRWLYDTYKYGDVEMEAVTCDAQKDKPKRLFPHQNFIRQFVSPHNPYRGLLLFHSLGTGKTCSSIAAMDTFLAKKPPVYVFLPASLSPNYRKELLECAEVGFQNRKWGAYEITDPKFIPKLAACLYVDTAWLKAREDGVFAWYQKDQIATAIQEGWITVIPGKPRKFLIQNSIDFILDKHFQFVHYNGLTRTAIKKWEEQKENPFDNSLIVIDEAHNFVSRVVHGRAIAKSVYKLFMSAKNAKFILLSGTPLINDPFELCYMLNLLRGEIRGYRYKILKTAKEIPNEEGIWKLLTDLKLHSYVNHVEVSAEHRTMTFYLLPEGFQWASTPDASLVQKAPWPVPNEEGMMDQIHEAVQKKLHLGKTLEKCVFYALPNDREKFSKYFLEAAPGSDASNPDEQALRVANPTLFMNRIQGIVSYFKSNGESLMPRIAESQIVKVPMSDHQFKYYQGVRTLERRMALKGRGKTTDSGNVYRAFSRMACNFVFPESIKRPFPSDLRKEVDFGDEEKPKDKDADDKAATGVKPVADYEAILRDIRRKMTEKADDYLKENLGQYSPKFVKVLENLQKSPGCSLLYTQFRSVEGIGLFTDVLTTHGWKPLDIIKTQGGGWKFAEPLDPASARIRRFIAYPSERDRAEVLLDLYNGRWDKLPSDMQKQLADAGYKTNTRGELVQLLMITQSGAEGLSLRNVRQVHILEPYWNQIRLDQVIGRAVRTCSHQDLPVNERDVRVFTYVSTLTQAQLNDAFTIRRMDKSMTSDEHILMIAQNKNRLIQEFLDLMKKTAVDCVLHAGQNQPTYACFAHPTNQPLNERVFIPDIDRDVKDYVRPRMERKESAKGRVVLIDGKKYVEVSNMPGLYDYAAYKHAKVLHPVA